MCQTSNLKPLNENSIMMQSGHSYNALERNGGSCKKMSKIQDSADSSMPQKLRKIDSSETTNNMSSQRNQGINSSSQNKMFSQTTDSNDSETKANKNSSLSHSDRKTAQTTNLQNTQTKIEGGLCWILF